MSEQRPAILYAGRISAEKGLSLLGRVGELLAEYRLAHRFVFCGDGPMRDRLDAMMPDAIFTGRVPHEEVGEIMASCDLFVFPSETDTAGNVVLEAQAAGLPIVVTDRGGPRENLIDRITGFICHARSEQDFCCRIAELLVDRHRRTAMSAAARAYALSRTWGNAMPPLFDSYREAVRFAASRQRASTPVHPHEAAV